MAVADAVLVKEPAETSPVLVLYVPVQVVEAPGANGLAADAQLIFAFATLSSVMLYGDVRLTFPLLVRV